MDKQKFKEVEAFLSSYNQICRELIMLKTVADSYDVVDINEEIESRSLYHPAGSDNIGAGRNISISQKTANIALTIDNYSTDLLKQKEKLKPKICELQTQISLIKTFSNSLSGVNAEIFNARFISDEKFSFDEIAKKISKLNSKCSSLGFVRNRYIKLVTEFSNFFIIHS